MRFDLWLGLDLWGLIGVVLPVIAVRHVYGLYHQLEEAGKSCFK